MSTMNKPITDVDIVLIFPSFVESRTVNDVLFQHLDYTYYKYYLKVKTFEYDY